MKRMIIALFIALLLPMTAWADEPLLESERNDPEPVAKAQTLNAYDGIYEYNGRTETYYSSNVLYHQRTGEWEVDGNGFYRTKDGYFVVAASDIPQGTVFMGSMGLCQVLDSGCAEGVTDYYTNWL